MRNPMSTKLQRAETRLGSFGPRDTEYAVTFKITRHAGSRRSTRPRPANAMDLLWRRLDVSRGDASFAKVGPEISATWQMDAPGRVPRDELSAVGRLAVLDVVREVCEHAPELELEWFAISPV
jgi:hypothetical protein